MCIRDSINRLPQTKDCIAIFPNPTVDVLKLEMKDYLGKTANIKIISSKGETKEVRKVEEVTDGLLDFQVSDYPAGTYYINIQVGEVVSTKCFVVTKN